MKKKTEKEYLEYITSVIKKWSPRLLLDSHIIGIQKDNEYFLACKFRYPYMDVQILWSDKSFKDWCKDENQEHEIVHELCHVITDPLYAKAVTQWVSQQEVEDERERLTDRIAVILLKSYEA